MKKQTSNMEQAPRLDSVSDRIYREVSEAEIATRAYQIYQSRGAEDGADVDDWLQAERELRELPSVKNAAA